MNHPLRPGDRVEINIGRPVPGTITSINPSFGTAVIDYGSNAPFIESLENLKPITPPEHRDSPDKSPSPDKSGPQQPTAPAEQRLHIAAMAMQGLLAYGTPNSSPLYLAQRAVEYADALITQLNTPAQ